MLSEMVAPSIPQVELRSPVEVMRLERMGSFFPTRLSFLRSLLRKLAESNAKVERPFFNLDADGYGYAVYQIELDGRPYSLIAYSEALADEDRTDRVIAQAWDVCFVLFDGIPTQDDIAHLRDHATKQEAGNYDPRVLVLSRANKSVRLFDHVVEMLSKGEQPDAKMVGDIGYLMRTTAVYGNGKFGMADRAAFMDRPSLSQPFRLEMLTVYLIREFTLDLVNHVARIVGKEQSVELADNFRRQLGIGNSTGLGMAPFLVSHPILINNWMMVRETALARVRAVKQASDETKEEFKRLLQQTTAHLLEWNVDDPIEQKRIERLRAEFEVSRSDFQACLEKPDPWNAMYEASLTCSIDLQELVVALILEPHGELVDGLCECMEGTEVPKLDPAMTVKTIRKIVEDHYQWATSLDLSNDESSAMVWYVSEEKLEPRFGERGEGSQERRAMPHHIAHQVQSLKNCLDRYDENDPIALLLMAHPELRNIVRRMQTIARHPFGDIQDNLVAKGVRPIDMLRCKLSFFGASKFDPRSDRWTRITLYQGAPTARDLTLDNCNEVFLPAFEAAQ